MSDIIQNIENLAIAIAEASVPVWGSRVQITVDDTGSIVIPANANRKTIRISNSDDEECFFSFGTDVPVWKEDIQLKKKLTVIFKADESGAGAITFITNNGKTTLITYQEGV